MWNSVPCLFPLCELMVLETNGPIPFATLPVFSSHSPAFHWLAPISLWMMLQHLVGWVFSPALYIVFLYFYWSAFPLPALYCSFSLVLHVFIGEFMDCLLSLSASCCLNKVPEIITLKRITFGSHFERFLANGWILLTCSSWARGLYNLVTIIDRLGGKWGLRSQNSLQGHVPNDYKVFHSIPYFISP